MKRTILGALLAVYSLPILAQQNSVKLSQDERTLYRLIMAYRAEQGLATVPLSASLSKVAQVHAWDTITHRPDLGVNGSGVPCNLHSWSDQGQWSSICFTGPEGSFMWDKPRELTSYQGNGFEISFGSDPDYPITPALALEGWKGSQPHNDVILNRGPWTTPWQAIGIGIYRGHAHVWFGMEADPQGEPDPSVAQGLPQISPNTHYRLQNLLTENENLCLEGNHPDSDYLQGGAFLDRCQVVSGQAWMLAALGGSRFKITNAYLASAGLCLDSNNPENQQAEGRAYMSACTDLASQNWLLRPQGGHGYFALASESAENLNLCLGQEARGDGSKDIGIRLEPCGPSASQLWQIKNFYP